MDTPLLALTSRRTEGAAIRSEDQATAENMRQLIQLRWLAVTGQLLAILGAQYGLGVPLPVAVMLAVVGLLAIANLLFTLTLRRPRLVMGEVSLALLLDMAALTAQLYLSGGSANPFISLYLLQIALAAILLPPGMALLLLALSCFCVGFLSVAHLPLLLPEQWDVSADLFVLGEWLSFSMVAALLVLFITRISRNLRARDAHVAELGQRAAEEDGIVRMGLFASGAAHELSTPLSSLSVLVADWQHDPKLRRNPQFQEELADAQAELARCKEIVSNILDSAGQTRGEAMASTSVEELLGEIVAAWGSVRSGTPLHYRAGPLEGALVAAEPALRQAIWNILENASEASPDGIGMAAEIADEHLVLSITDTGPGFPAEKLAAIGGPYQSSKGAGHGVGLFLASNVARRLGGALEAENREQFGAIVRLTLPLASAGTREEER